MVLTHLYSTFIGDVGINVGRTGGTDEFVRAAPETLICLLAAGCCRMTQPNLSKNDFISFGTYCRPKRPPSSNNRLRLERTALTCEVGAAKDGRRNGAGSF